MVLHKEQRDVHRKTLTIKVFMLWTWAHSRDFSQQPHLTQRKYFSTARDVLTDSARICRTRLYLTPCSSPTSVITALQAGKQAHIRRRSDTYRNVSWDIVSFIKLLKFVYPEELKCRFTLCGFISMLSQLSTYTFFYCWHVVKKTRSVH